jgi:polynucleotide 5'-kinase involved in rRNA processing
MAIGAPGSGKTTFCLYLAGLFCRHEKNVAWIDADPGQPFTGPPAVISLALYSDAADLLKRRTPPTLSFIGNTSPVGRLLDLVSGVQKLVTLARAMNPGLILINTCGLVQGGAARELKFHEIDMIAPHYVVALQKGNEVEHLLAPHSHRAGLLIHRLPVSPEAKVSTGEARRAAREQRFKEYFRGADFQEIALHDVGVHGPGLGAGERLGFRDINRISNILQAIVIHAELSADQLFLLVEGDYAGDELYTAKEQYNVREVTVLKRSELDHLLVGLNDDRNICLGLGILRDLDVKELSIRVITPLRDLSTIRNISLGSLRVSPAGGELGQW